MPAVGGVEDGAEVVRKDHGSKDGRRADDVELRAEEDRIEGKAAPRDFGLGRNDARHGDGRAARGRPGGAAGRGSEGEEGEEEGEAFHCGFSFVAGCRDCHKSQMFTSVHKWQMQIQGVAVSADAGSASPGKVVDSFFFAK